MLSTCSEYFEEMFERTQCKHPIIVLKDIKHDDLEALLNYMYIGEVNVVQEKLANLIKAAECLKIKGLAVPDEDPTEGKENIGRESHKRSQRTEDSPRAKRRRRDNSLEYSDDVLGPVKTIQVNRNRDQQIKPSSLDSNNGNSETMISSDSKQIEDTSVNNKLRNSNKLTTSSHSKENIPEEVSNYKWCDFCHLLEIYNFMYIYSIV